mmetsp:Transcript_12644/g.15051  ORF Transcript_12644/g.15051 Transcript_12644/m.15051 type:complete len:179 (+) Transcript_12644:62-598(+)
MVKKLSDELLDHVYKGGFIHCKDIHDHTCVMNALLKLRSVFKAATKFYVPLHCVPVLLFKRRALFENPGKTSARTLKNIVKSCLFLGVYVAVFQYMLCFSKNARHKVDRWNVVIATFVCGFAFLFEAKPRQNELVMYMLPRVLESLYNLMIEKGHAKAFKFGEVLIFACCMSLIMYCY